MKITCSTERRCGRRIFFDLLVDDEVIATLDRALIRPVLVASWEATSREELEETLSSHLKSASRRFCLQRLAKAALHSQALVRLLVDRAVPLLLAQEVVGDLIRLNVVDDQAWREQKLSRWKREGKSALVVRRKLSSVGCREQVSFDEVDVLSSLIAKKFSFLLEPTLSFPQRQKGVASLLRRGFRLDSIRAALYILKENKEQS